MEPEEVKELFKVYPFNLARAIFNNDDDAIGVCIPGITAALQTLTDREIGIIHLRHKDEMSYRKIGDVYGITGGRVGQIYTRALRKLRHPAKANNYLYSRLQGRIRRLTEDNDILKKENGKLRLELEVCMRRLPPDEPIPIAKTVADTEIEGLGFSVRLYNALKRNGVNVVWDIARLSKGKIKGFRNLGEKTFNELQKWADENNIQIRE